MKRWRIGRGASVAVVIAGLGVAVAGCGGSSNSNTGGGGGGSSSSGGHSIVVADTSSVQKLNPAIMTNFLDFQALGMIYQPLVALSQNLTVTPDLATSWATSNGGRTLTLHLRQGVKFDDGSTFDSTAVKDTLEYIVKPSTAAAAASYLATVKSISTPSKYTVVLNLSQPDSSVLYGLTSENMAMLSPQAIKAGTLETKPDGTGPYEFSSYSPNNSFTVKSDPSYWGPKPSISHIEFRTIANEQSIGSALQAGTVQVGLLTEPQVIQQVQGSNVKVDKQLDLNYRAMMLQSKGPLANVNARLAVQCAINRKAVLQAAVQGFGKVIGPVPSGPFASDPNTGVCANPSDSQAKSYLAKAGEPHGFSFTVMTSEALDGTSTAQATTIQNELAKVGIKMNINNLASSAYIQNWLKGNFQGTLALNGASPSPYIMYGRYFGKGASLKVPAGYSSSTLQSLLSRGDQSTSSSEQHTLWNQMYSYLNNNAVWIWLFNAYDYYVTTPNLKGFTPLPNGQLTSLATATLG